MRIKLQVIAVAVCLITACGAYAQRGGGQGRRGGNRNNFSISGLAFRPDVQADLALTEDEKTKLTTLRESLRTAGGGGAGAGGTRPTPEEMQARDDERTKQVEAILTPDQVTRIHEIQIQLAGPMALRFKSVQTGLALTPDEVTKIDTLYKSYNDANRSIQEKQRNNEIDRPTATADREKNTVTLKEDLEKVLTADQDTKFKGMGGKPFTAAPAPAPGT